MVDVDRQAGVPKAVQVCFPQLQLPSGIAFADLQDAAALIMAWSCDDAPFDDGEDFRGLMVAAKVYELLAARAAAYTRTARAVEARD